MKEVKILGIVIAVPPLSSPGHLYRWFLAWKREQIMGPAFRNLGEAMRGAASAIKQFGETYKRVMKELGNGDDAQ